MIGLDVMRENKYDNPIFFQKYSEMARSQQGLAGAGEWTQLQKMLPDFTGMSVLDLGCGYGWHCKYAAEHGAAYVLGTDISQKMLETAAQCNGGPNIEYRQAAMEDLKCSEASFDCVLSSLAFHYISDFAALVQRINRWLKPGESSSFRWNILYLPPTALKTGTMMRMGPFFTFRLTTTMWRGSGTPFFWGSRWPNTIEH